MLASTNQSLKKTASHRPGILNRNRLPVPPISIIIFIFLFSFFLFLFSCQRSTESLPNNNGPDTTSHNFTWKIDTIGTRSSSLSDVAIINENDIWAVGEIYTEEQTPYNTAHWNGKEWKLKRLFSDKVISPVRGIWAISDNNIWLAAGSIYHWDGNKANLSYLRDISTNEVVQKLWYNNENDIYGVGTEGIIVHYNGQNWQRLDSGTDIDIQDIWGSGDELMAIASYEYYGIGLTVLQINGTTVTRLDTAGLRVAQSGIWFDPDKAYYIFGDGVFKKYNSINQKFWVKEEGHPLRYKIAVRGISSKDLFVVGGHGLVSHYNGATWKHYTDNELPSFYGNWWSVAFKDNMVVAVGNEGGVKGLILRGYRN